MDTDAQKAKRFTQLAREAFQKGKGVRDVAKLAREMTVPTWVEPKSKVHTADEFIQRIIKRLTKIRFNKKINGDLEFLKKLKHDLHADTAEKLRQEFDALAAWAKGTCRELEDLFPETRPEPTEPPLTASNPQPGLEYSIPPHAAPGHAEGT